MAEEWISTYVLCARLRIKRNLPDSRLRDGKIDEHLTKMVGGLRKWKWPDIQEAFPEAKVEDDKDDDNITFEQAQLLDKIEAGKLKQLQRRQKEGELLDKETVYKTWELGVGIVKTRLLGLPSAAKLKLPHLTPRDIETITELIYEALNELANGEVKS